MKTIETIQDFYNEIDMLKGNINRMSVTSDLTELNNMFIFAIRRLSIIYDYKKHELMNKESV